MSEGQKDDIDSCDECECKDAPSQTPESSENQDSQLKVYKDFQVAAINKQIPVNSVLPALNANPYRSGAIFCNIGTVNLLIRVHETQRDPTVSGPTAIIKVLVPNETYTPDNKCVRRVIQGNICVVNPDLATVGVISIAEVLSKPDVEPYDIGGRYGTV